MPRAPLVAVAGFVLCGALGCSSSAADDAIPVGLMLSYSGYLAANSVNSERALLMAIEAANAAGGVGGRLLRVVARNTRSDVNEATRRARELVEAGAPVVIGPDTVDLVTALRTTMQDRTLILPSFATASDVEFKPASWFVMGAGTTRVACELVAQLKIDGRRSPLLIENPTGYNSFMSWVLSNKYGMARQVLSMDNAPNAATVQQITSVGADAYVLAAFPASASTLIYGLSALGALPDPTRWYLSPTLHTPAFSGAIPKAALAGAHGVSPGTAAGAADFRARFFQRWEDVPLDDAYPFYDAGAVVALALQRALTQTGAIPDGTGLAAHVIAVTHAGGVPVSWDELDHGLELVQQGMEVEYIGLSGLIEFDLSGDTQASVTNWWTIAPSGFVDVPAMSSDCR